MQYNFLEDNSQFLKSFYAITESDFYNRLTPELGYQHKIGHIQKVMFFSKIIAQFENLDETETKILLASAAFHDSGRTKDKDNGEHGILSVEIADNYFKDNPVNPYGINKDEIGIIKVAIAYHVINDTILGEVDEKIIFKLCQEYGINDKKNFKKAKRISAILKDADALDRARFSSKITSKNIINTKMLRTETAKDKDIIELAMNINQIYAGFILRKNYPNESVEQGDNARTLQLLRHDYRLKNDGERKIEKEISTKLVISLFSNALKSIKEKDEEFIL